MKNTERFYLTLFLVIGVVFTTPLFVRPGGTPSPQIRLSADSLSFFLPRFTQTEQTLTIYNVGDELLHIALRDSAMTPAATPAITGNIASIPGDWRALLHRLARINLQSLLPIAGPSRTAPIPSAFTTVAIVDSAGDAAHPGRDVVSVDIGENLLSYQFTIQFAGTPDTAAVALMSLDVDQNICTGSFPAPFGVGPVFYDVGSEFDIVFDIAGLLSDTLNVPPIAVVVHIADSTITPIAVSLPLEVEGNTVRAQFIKALSPGFALDENMNAALTLFSINRPEVPDFAPDYGHGVLGSETGVGWLGTRDADGQSEIPLERAILPGDSLHISVKVAGVNPGGHYRAALVMVTNVPETPVLTVPVSVQIDGDFNPAIRVSPAAIADTLRADAPPQIYSLTITNTGTGVLIFFLGDSLASGEGWLILPDLPLGQVAGGASATVDVSVNPAGLTPNRSYSGIISMRSNDADLPLVEIPVQIFIDPSTGIISPPVVPRTLRLYPNYPNPFNPLTRIKFDLPTANRVKLMIYNAIGQPVVTLVDEDLTAGTYVREWQGRDSRQQAVSSGIYLVRLRVGQQLVATQKILLSR